MPSGLKDQPNGKCMECIWNSSADDDMDCNVPQVMLVNHTCIMKIQATFLGNINYHVGKGFDE